MRAPDLRSIFTPPLPISIEQAAEQVLATGATATDPVLHSRMLQLKRALDAVRNVNAAQLRLANQLAAEGVGTLGPPSLDVLNDPQLVEELKRRKDREANSVADMAHVLGAMRAGIQDRMASGGESAGLSERLAKVNRCIVRIAIAAGKVRGVADGAWRPDSKSAELDRQLGKAQVAVAACMGEGDDAAKLMASIAGAILPGPMLAALQEKLPQLAARIASGELELDINQVLHSGLAHGTEQAIRHKLSMGDGESIASAIFDLLKLPQYVVGADPGTPESPAPTNTRDDRPGPIPDAVRDLLSRGANVNYAPVEVKNDFSEFFRTQGGFGDKLMDVFNLGLAKGEELGQLRERNRQLEERLRAYDSRNAAKALTGPEKTFGPARTSVSTSTDSNKEPTREPEPTKEPEPPKVPEPPKMPEPTKVPEPPKMPEPPKKPEPTEKPEPTRKPEPPKKPEPTGKPEPTKEPEPTKKPEPTREPEPTRKPEPTRNPNNGPIMAVQAKELADFFAFAKGKDAVADPAPRVLVREFRREWNPRNDVAFVSPAKRGASINLDTSPPRQSELDAVNAMINANRKAGDVSPAKGFAEVIRKKVHAEQLRRTLEGSAT